MPTPPRILNVKSEEVEIGRLVPHPLNINQGDFGAIEASMKQNGFYGSLTVQVGTCHILAGNHRYYVAKRLGYQALPVDWVDCTDEQAIRVMLSDNRSARLGTDNPASLAELLKELAETEMGLLGTGYDGDFLDDLLSDLNRPADFSGMAAPPTPPDRIEREKQPRIPREADKDGTRNKDGERDGQEERTRLGVVIFCDSEADQDYVYRKNVEMGWCPSKTTFSEQSYTRLREEAP